MPKNRPTHYNPPDDDERTACGRHLDRVDWDRAPERVTCKACQKVMK